MFGLFKKEFKVLSPLNGKMVPLESVPDPVFSQRIVGDGVAIDDLQGDIACAPVDGTIVLIFRTNHAFAVKMKNDVEILVHIGIDTVELNGEGFERLVEEGSVVKAGDPVIRFNRNVIVTSGRSIISPVIITTKENIAQLSVNVVKQVSTGKDVIFSYKLK
ncbi:PTS glucose transporter subunit IIA [Pelosinus sp. sgz500959]|uniref:PTS sugar transporter subunit IIA n=1 Tax=Pelosinus sp. sgz500959 TaxID=3242472 RepID=UPI00366C3E04